MNNPLTDVVAGVWTFWRAQARHTQEESVSNPNGVTPHSPGLLYSATLGDRNNCPNPNGVTPHSPGLQYTATRG